MSEKGYLVSYRIVAFVVAESGEQAIEQVEAYYTPRLHPEHMAYVSVEEEEVEEE